MIKTAIGQDSHPFESQNSSRKLILGGVEIEGHRGCAGNSDADVIMHAITNALSGISGVTILGAVTDRLCKTGITDSREYVKRALDTLKGYQLTHISVSLEMKTPRLAPYVEAIKASVADTCGIDIRSVGITATSGEGLTAFGRGEGIQAFVIVTAEAHEPVRE